jgi:signal peptidase I
MLLLGLGLALAVRQWVGTPTLLVGASMEPTFRSGRLAVVNKLAYHFRDPRRGDIVLVNTGRELHAKRIIGLPGEEVALQDGLFYVNGHLLAEPYVRFPGCDTIAAGRLGANRFLVVGDNRPESILAVVKRERIVGRLSTVHSPQSTVR